MITLAVWGLAGACALLWWSNCKLASRVTELRRALEESDAQVREAMRQSARMAYRATARHAGAVEAADVHLSVSRHKES